MAKLPLSRVVNVSLTREDRFPTRSGFGIPLILTSDADGESAVNPTVRTRVYGSMDEVADEWDAGSAAYRAAQAVFSQNPSPIQIKIGYCELPGEGDISGELDAVVAFDDEWYWMVFTSEFRDLDAMDDAIAWVEARNKQLFLCSNDAATESVSDQTSVAARNKGGAFDRTSVFYHDNGELYPDAAAAGYVATRNFDQAATAYTLKFKKLGGVTPVNKPSAVIQAITGFVPNLGLDANEGHLANTYVNIGGLDMVVEGNTLSRAFIDEIHASDWLVARAGEEVLSVLTNNDRVPMTNTGVHMLVAAVEAVMERAALAGLIADVEDAATGEYLPAYEIQVERVESMPAATRRNRIAPDIRVNFRYAGAVHYVTVRLTMQF